ncbi:unnamed protein product [Effrenium voratum]|nr:unnamed protein product [Effrenium voratum]
MGASSSVHGGQLQQLRTTRFANEQGLTWSGLSGVSEVVASVTDRANLLSELRSGGQLLLRVRATKNNVEFMTAEGVVCLVHLKQLGNLFSGSQTTWTVWSATGGEAFEAPNGTMMSKCGMAATVKEGLVEYKNTTGTLIMRLKLDSYTQCTALGFNDELIGVCQDMANNHCIAGRVTVAAGVDALLVLALSTQLLSICG